ncbi:hypothetical protein [Roseovarius nitratireducens]|uniref:hypothetical protein n=1 Tax=Roseovarius nitratireducens TaxID=2044597 RepID=UPI000CE1FA39|nr:hypothetical protein [Roseovarius nitratireducens]
MTIIERMNEWIMLLAVAPAIAGVLFAGDNARSSDDPREPGGPLDQTKAWKRAAAISFTQAICAALALALVVGF